MNKALIIFFMAIVLACGEGSDRAQEGEAAVEEEVDVGAGEDISPQLELDSGDSRFEVDTVSSPQEVKDETEKESF